jgi:hypothetical protein
MYKYTDSRGLEVHSFGRLELYIKPEKKELAYATLHTTGVPFDPFLTLPPKDFQALMKVLEFTFDDPERSLEEGYSFDLWKGSSFFYLAPMAHRSDLFWISSGPLNVYLPTEKMREVYADILSAGDLIQ